MNISENSEYGEFQQNLMLNPSRNSSFTWEIRTLRSRDVLVSNILNHVTLSKKISKCPKERKKPKFLKNVLKFLTCSSGIEPEVVPYVVPEIVEKNQRLKTELNDLKLVSLSYQAEMINLREEIENLQKEKLQLIQKRKTSKSLKSSRISKRKLSKTQSSSGCSSMKSRDLSRDWMTPIDSTADILFVC